MHDCLIQDLGSLQAVVQHCTIDLHQLADYTGAAQDCIPVFPLISQIFFSHIVPVVPLQIKLIHEDETFCLDLSTLFKRQEGDTLTSACLPPCALCSLAEPFLC